jgi:ribosomal-protein-alanine N-acetyltransferase
MIRHFTPFPTLHTQRLVLRQLTMEDEQGIFDLRSNDTVNRFLDRPKAQSVNEARQFIQKILDNNQKNEGLYWVIALQHDPKLIGTIGLWNFSEEENMAETGFELLPQYHGQGFMQEALTKVIEFAFTIIQLQTIEAWVQMNNMSSIKLLERNHFIPKPLQEQDTSKPVDMVIYILNKA